MEAVHDHLLKLARVRFLLADDAGAGKTIMAGLLLRELQLRGLAERILIVAPSARDESHKSQRYRLGGLLRDSSDHMLLLTATLVMIPGRWRTIRPRDGELP